MGAARTREMSSGAGPQAELALVPALPSLTSVSAESGSGTFTPVL